MKKVTFIIAALFIACNASAQLAEKGAPRKYTAAEKQRWAQICNWMGNAFPKTFKDWQYKPCNCSSFEWAETRDDEPLTVVDLKDRPINGNPFYSVAFVNGSDEASARVDSLEREEAANYNDREKVEILSAMRDKMQQCTTLSIYATFNRNVDFSPGRYADSRLEKLELGVTGYAYLYKKPWGKVLMDEDGGSVGQYNMYLDEALVIITPRQVKVTATPVTGKRTYVEDKVLPPHVADPISLGPVEYVVVGIKGDEKDIRDIIARTDWKSLQAMLGK